MSIRLKQECFRYYPNALEGVYLHGLQKKMASVDIYLYLEYGVAVPSVAVAIQKRLSSTCDMADVTEAARKP